MPSKDIEVRRATSRKYYRNHRKEMLKRAADRKKEIRAWFNELKSKLKCKKCSETHPGCLDFHHRDGKTKEYPVYEMASGGYGRERILSEIAKCDVLCSNCHRKHHYKNRGKHTNVGNSGRK